MAPKTFRKRPRYCRLPSPGSITGRSSSITNAFFNALVPIHTPSEHEELEALSILAMNPADIRCAYCGDVSTEWDHLRPIITDQKPTGYITEIANLVPACGKCNQSKGKKPWRTWMQGNAPLSPISRGVGDIAERIGRLEAYEAWKQPTHVEFESIVVAEVWQRHRANWRQVLALMKESQKLAAELRDTIEAVVNQQRTKDKDTA